MYKKKKHNKKQKKKNKTSHCLLKAVHSVIFKVTCIQQ